jgi:hypothetical protein
MSRLSVSCYATLFVQQITDQTSTMCGPPAAVLGRRPAVQRKALSHLDKSNAAPGHKAAHSFDTLCRQAIER